jgi:hypothetical protein
MVRTTNSLKLAADSSLGDDLILEYLKDAQRLSEAMKVVIQDLVAEARLRGKKWDEIGTALGGMKVTAVQKRFAGGAKAASMDIKAEETKAVVYTSVIASGPHEGIEELVGEISDEWEGVDHLTRLRYAINIIINAHEGLARLFSTEQHSHEETVTALHKSFQRINLLTSTLILDRETWQAVAERRPPSLEPDATTYFAPATYLYYAMRRIMLITILTQRAFDLHDGHSTMVLYRAAQLLMADTIRVFWRKDVQAMVSEWAAD